jgi:hypothetical protein
VNWLLAVGYWLLAMGYGLWATGYALRTPAKKPIANSP